MSWPCLRLLGMVSALAAVASVKMHLMPASNLSCPSLAVVDSLCLAGGMKLNRTLKAGPESPMWEAVWSHVWRPWSRFSGWPASGKPCFSMPGQHQPMAVADYRMTEHAACRWGAHPPAHLQRPRVLPWAVLTRRLVPSHRHHCNCLGPSQYGERFVNDDDFPSHAASMRRSALRPMPCALSGRKGRFLVAGSMATARVLHSTMQHPA